MNYRYFRYLLRKSCEQEEDGRFLAEVIGFLGVLAYGQTREEAVAIQALALRVLADKLEHRKTK